MWYVKEVGEVGGWEGRLEFGWVGLDEIIREEGG